MATSFELKLSAMERLARVYATMAEVRPGMRPPDSYELGTILKAVNDLAQNIRPDAGEEIPF